MLAFLFLRNLFLCMLDKEGNENYVYNSVLVQLSEQWVYGDAYRNTGSSLEVASLNHMDDNSGTLHHCSFLCNTQTAMPLWSLLLSSQQLFDACMTLYMCLGQEVA